MSNLKNSIQHIVEQEMKKLGVSGLDEGIFDKILGRGKKKDSQDDTDLGVKYDELEKEYTQQGKIKLLGAVSVLKLTMGNIIKKLTDRVDDIADTDIMKSLLDNLKKNLSFINNAEQFLITQLNLGDANGKKVVKDSRDEFSKELINTPITQGPGWRELPRGQSFSRGSSSVGKTSPSPFSIPKMREQKKISNKGDKNAKKQD